MTHAISVAGLSRSYRGHLALDRVGFEVATGSITGLLGRNGAGKTTLLRILAGQEFSSAGQAVIEAPTWVTAVGGLPGSEPLSALHPLGQWTSVLTAVITCGIG
jgi:ATPase subunit of ABC transporter with duplicated ATPase domains